jgi:hypothetical protein
MNLSTNVLCIWAKYKTFEKPQKKKKKKRKRKKKGKERKRKQGGPKLPRLPFPLATSHLSPE